MRLATSLLVALLASSALAVLGCSDSGSSSSDGGNPDAASAVHDAEPAADAILDPELVEIDGLAYLGGFRLPDADFGASSTNYAVGTLAYNPANHSLFIAGHAQQNAVAEFPIPAPGAAENVGDLPVADAPLQVFHAVLDQSPNGNPEGIDRITGMLVIDGQLLINAETWYDAAGENRDTTLAVRDADALDGAIDGYFELAGAARAGGYMAPIPGEWQGALGGAYLTGWSSVYSIISRYSVGPTLFVFDPGEILDAASGAQGPVATTAFMDFSFGAGHYLDPDGLETQQGSASALWNFLSAGVFGLVIPGTRTFAVFGSSGGVDSGIGYKITQDDGNLCGGYCSYAAADNYNYYWFFDVEEILSAPEVYSARPYAYGRWSVPFDDDGVHAIRGGTFDAASGVIYLALEGAGQVGDYDYTPLIVAFAMPR